MNVKLIEILMVDAAGDPGALESQIRQLGKALDDSRFQMQQTENIIHSKTPTGPELDSGYTRESGVVSRGSILGQGCRRREAARVWRKAVARGGRVRGSLHTPGP